MERHPEDENVSSSNSFLQERESKIISLNKNECLFLDDCFTVIIDGREMQGLTTLRNISSTASVPVTVDLIQKIGRAVLFTTDRNNGGKEALVEVDETDLLALREVAQSYVKMEGEAVGVNLKRKILSLLLENSYAQEVKKQKDYRYWLRTLNQIAPRKHFDQHEWTYNSKESYDEMWEKRASKENKGEDGSK
jgi:hypothetical protein